MSTPNTNKKPNHLINETSPYLLQHAYNPVEWYPWGEEALSKAKKENKPILVSIGYAACHWCHVMERESFENEETATLMNSHFVNIKIDREERPDLDHLYMDAVQTMTGSGGWPLNVFLTTDQKPFYGGTYFPPVPAHGRASWQNVLISLADAWMKRRDEIVTQADTLISHMQKAGNFTPSINIVANKSFVFTKDSCREMAVNLLAAADTTDGGFGAAPKFLHTPSITYLLQHAHFFNNSDALAQAELSLKKMLQGGIYDQVGGGISRYSTDAHWLVPHFEKMLYDNALLLGALSEAFQLTKDKQYVSSMLHIFSFLQREMKDTKGGFYAALDADSDGVEGKFYIWKKQELETLLGEDCGLYSKFYNVVENGNIPPEHTAWKDENILHITASAHELAPNFGLSLDAFEKKIIKGNDILLRERQERIRPQTDTKIILAWNALIITSFCKCFAATGEMAFLDEAVSLHSFIENNFKDDSSFYGHAVTNSTLKNPAFLDDLSFYIQACIALQEVTGNEYYLQKAKILTEYVCDHFSDEENIFFYFTSDLQSDIILRKKEIHDGAMPSANAIMLSSLLYLAIVLNNLSWNTRAEKMLQFLEKAILRHPSSFGEWAKAYQLQSIGMNEIAVTGKDFAKLLQLIGQEFIPNKILQATSSVSDMPLLKGKKTDDNSLIFVCRNYTCNAPVARVAEMMELLNN